METAVEAMKMGAFDYIPKPFTPDEVSVVVKKALEKRTLQLENVYLRQELQEKYGFHNIVGKSRKMQEIYRVVAKVAPTDSTVLIYGQSGTGKELIARAIHFNSQRREKQFVPVDCAVLSENLLESEVVWPCPRVLHRSRYDQARAIRDRRWRNIFLDEVGNISLAIQAKLLRVLQEREFTPVGGTKVKKVDIRLVAATNKNLEKMMKEETFREDLYYRLNIVPIYLPPLKERRIFPCWRPIFLESMRKKWVRQLTDSPLRPWNGSSIPLAGEYPGTGKCDRTECRHGGRGDGSVRASRSSKRARERRRRDSDSRKQRGTERAEETSARKSCGGD